MVQILLIEHDDVRGLWPFSATHGSWELRCGHLTMLERWQAVARESIVDVSSPRQHIESAYRERPDATAQRLASHPTLVMSAHVLMPVQTMRDVLARCSDVPLLFRCQGDSVGIFIPQPLDDVRSINDAIAGMDADRVETIDVQGVPITNLWQVFDHLATTISSDATLLAQEIHPTATVHPTAVIDRSNGPVIIGEHADVGPLSVLIGPCSIGARTRVKSHAVLHKVAVGPVCKVAGEIEDAVLHGYANKQHDGFLGHSYLGEWTNLGAGTITSDLMNTYGDIIVSTPWGRVNTERMFLGLLAGDHVKTAIGTCFMTGTLAGVCANVVGEAYPARSIPSFMWKDTSTPRYNIEKALAVARTVMARRGWPLGPATEALLRSIHEGGDV